MVKRKEYERATALLHEVLVASNKKKFEINPHVKRDLDLILKNAENNKGVLAVTITSLVKKVLDPEQDIRLHQDKLMGGYSGRTLDANSITPFLKQNNFPAMSESGWLTRSLEQSSPYTIDYKGAIKPQILKKAFLQTLDRVQKTRFDPRIALEYLLSGLVKARDEQTSFKLAKPVNRPIRTIISYLHSHFTRSYHSGGAARLPVLAIYAAYQAMVKEVTRFKDCSLMELRPHTSADRRTGSIGDIQVSDENGRVFEAVEVKHGIQITSAHIREAYTKFKTQPVKRYYLLTTSYERGNNVKITKEIMKISQEHGCQVIVNGVEPTLLYYLRLLKTPDICVSNYVELVEKEPAIKFEHKQAWNEIVTNQKSERWTS